MKKKIAILGSTGSIGKTLINIIKKDKKNFEIVLLSADENYKELLKQAKLFKVKNLIITNKKSYNKIIVKKKSDKIKIFNNFESFKKIFRNKIDYAMSSIVGLDGLEPTINIIKYRKKHQRNNYNSSYTLKVFIKYFCYLFFVYKFVHISKKMTSI